MNIDYSKTNGFYSLGFDLSNLEKQLFQKCSEHLSSRGLEYLSLPITVNANTILHQDVIPMERAFGISNLAGNCYLGGSAEQSFLEYFTTLHSFEAFAEKHPLLFSETSCFRSEKYSALQDKGLKYVTEFKKIEQFALCQPSSWKSSFDFLLENATNFLDLFDITWRIVDKTKEDVGYHLKKADIEVFTNQYGWMETHSCTYFGDEQLKRFGINSSFHTISNTGIASPRILIPFIEGNTNYR